MDLHVEKQCIEKMKGGNTKQFLMLFDAYFSEVYTYVARRISDNFETERIVRLTFLDAIADIQGTPEDISYLVWLYSMAKPRAWMAIEKASFPEKQGLISKVPEKDIARHQTILEKAEKLFKKLSLEEREILKLKFFEQASDGEVLAVLGIEDEQIGPKIYRVLKRAHFLLFGESDERQGVYFGELSSFMGRVRSARKIDIPEAFKLSLRADISQKIDQRNMAIDNTPEKQKQPRKIEIKITEEKKNKQPQPPVKPFSKFGGGEDSAGTGPSIPSDIGGEKGFVKPVGTPVGSNDPAKIFVQAVKEMKEEDEIKKMEEKLKAEKREALLEFLDRWKILIFGLPIVLFVAVAAYVAVSLIDFTHKIPRKISYCEKTNVEIAFDENVSEENKKSLNKTFLNELCKTYEVATINVSSSDGKIGIEMKEKNGVIKYELLNKDGLWQITSYEKALNSNKKRRKV
ncbi:MAG: sigma-70 family RNA polymerase sigma factor [Candidatus Gracilibacteria bacterium]|jgi:RNA polymerase sigma-70 factor (ECF subfamily)